MLISISVDRESANRGLETVAEAWEYLQGPLWSRENRNKSKNIPISKLRIETKPKRFDVFQNLKWNVSICSKIFGTNPKLFDVFHLFFSRSKTFIFIPKILEQNQNFLMRSNFFLAKAKRYFLVQKLRNKTKTFGFSS